MNQKKIGSFLKELRNEKRDYTGTICRNLGRFRKERFQMGDRKQCPTTQLQKKKPLLNM